ncbi:hypothetical protein D9M68_815630 [compost metagenome]
MQAPVHIGIFVPESMFHPIQNLHRLLRRGPRVEIDQTVAVNLFAQDREIGTDLFEVEGHFNPTSRPRGSRVATLPPHHEGYLGS